ncbi:uncharacterized protein [Eurosta solidaginis]|uniref:uncharacterized protein n=1 Tax=Eurosta solidaginis TaxID=178769 RepID=UPI003530C478
MEEMVCAENYSVAQLRAWSRKLSLPISGTKSTLALRISAVPASESGECPTVRDDGVNVQTNVQIYVRDQQQEMHNEEASNFQSEDYNDDGDNGSKKNIQSDGKEIQLLMREIKLLERENDFLRRVSDYNGRAVGAAAQNSSEAASFKISKEMLLNVLPEFDGKTSVDVWLTQFKNVGNVYTLSDNDKRMLLLNKLKGKALQWMHSKPNFVTDSVDTLLDEMENVFKSKDSKLLLRKKFEAQWKVGEAFVDYFNEKVMLSVPIQLSEDEFVEYAIDGIADEQLRTQAYMQCYSTRAKLVQAFAKIKMKGDKATTTTAQREIRCYNCNSRGHFAAECKKPRREKGACYACGSTAHRAVDCPDKKKVVQLVDADEYEWNAS